MHAAQWTDTIVWVKGIDGLVCVLRSRALGESSRLALHQGLEYWDREEHTYKVGKFWSVRDKAMREELSQLKEKFPELPVDAGNVYRSF